MPQLYIAAAIASFIAVCMFGALIRQLAAPEHYRALLRLGCLGLCVSPLAYFFVRLPLIPLVEPIILGTTLENPNGTVSASVRGGVRLQQFLLWLQCTMETKCSQEFGKTK